MKQKLLLIFCLCFVLVMPLLAQDRTITGTVTDSETGEALPGVSVFVKGTNSGTVTDVNGKYSITASEGATLVFQAVGLASKEAIVGASSTLDMSLQPSTKELGEVVVTAVGLESDKRALGYSIQTVEPDELVNARETNLTNALNAKVAGVQVISSSGSPGSSANIRIRGNTSINGNNSPLFVVDGIPIDNQEFGNGVAGVDQSNRVVDLNPSDIASLTVLKGPAATALYGIRAANGAVVITTKRGKSGRPVVTLSSSFTVDQVNQLPDMQREYAQGRPSGGQAIWRGPETGEGFSWGPFVGDLEYDGDTDYAFDPRGRLVPTGQGNGMPAMTFPAADDFFVNGTTSDNNVSVSGGNDQMTYYASFGYLTQRGIVPNADFERITGRVNLDFNITEKFTAGVSAGYSQSGGNRIQRGSNISGVMLGLLRTTPTFDNGLGKEGRDAADFPDAYVLPDGTQRSYRAGIYDNPYWTVNRNPFEDDVDRIIGNINLSYQVLPWLQLSYKVGLDQYTDRRLFAFDINSADTPDGLVTTQTYNSRNLNSDALLIISKNFAQEFSIDATLGHNYFENELNIQQSEGFGLGVPSLYNLSNVSSIQSLEDISRRKVHGVFFDVKLGWRNMLFLNVSGRNDWSSVLPEDDNSFFYPAVSAGFVFSELIPENQVLSYGKLRLSWGQVGNDGGLAFIYSDRTYFNSSTIGGDGFITALTAPLNGIGAFERSTSAGLPTLQAETTETFEIGAEFGFWNDRISVDLTYYNSVSSDQIVNLDISAASGFTGRVLNAGEIENEGWELTTNANLIRTNAFSWDFSLNFTKFTNTVTELPDGVERISLAGFTSTSSNAIEGEPYGVIFGSRFRRNEEGQLIIGSNGWPLVEPTDGPVGDPNPDFLMGIRNTVSWKGITVSALLDIRQGGDVWCGTCGIMDYFGTSQRTSNQRGVTDFVFPGISVDDGSPNTTPVDFANPANGLGGNRWVRYAFGGLSEESIYDGSWVRLRELTVSYELPSSLFDNNFIQGVNISFTGRNLFLITDFPGIDPETNLTGASNGIGLEYFNMPNTKSYGVSLRVKI